MRTGVVSVVFGDLAVALSEVDDFELVEVGGAGVVADEEVGGFDVSMDYPRGVEVDHCLYNLLCNDDFVVCF